MSWRLARSLEVLHSQVNALFPNRRKENDGSIGDEAHSARTSDHNAWIKDGSGGPNVVSAIDITHDPAHGFDSYAFADFLRSKRDPRIKYLISNRRICSATESPWEWRPYNGANPHDHHVHISVKADKAHFDDPKPWVLEGFGSTPAAPAHGDEAVAQTELPQLRRGSSGADVSHLQTLLNKNGITVTVDEVFGVSTDAAVRTFQQRNHLTVDGVAGGYTWRALQAGLA